MSRIGRMPITVPAGVDVKLDNGNVVTVKGPKGTLTKQFNADMIIKHEGNEIIVQRPSEDKEHRALHGLTRALIANMVTGVTEGFSKSLEIVGVGYRAAKQGNVLNLSLGYSHPVNITETGSIKFEVPDANHIVVSGIDKQEVGQMAAIVRGTRPPEPYHGKGVKYSDEKIRRKAGKTGK